MRLSYKGWLSINPGREALSSTILYVEDNPLSLRLIRKVLESLGYGMIEASDGETGLALAAAQRPQMVLLDMDLPDMDGWTVARHIKNDPRMRHLPVVALTGNAAPGDRERCLLAGCDGYLSKPVSRMELRDMIHHFLPAGDAAG